MANPSSFHRSISLQALIFFSLLSVFVADLQGGYRCPGFSCGHLQHVQYPFRRPGDPPECGVGAYELVCGSSNATIYVKTGAYYVTGIDYTGSSFWVVDANWDTNNACPLPQLNQPLPQLNQPLPRWTKFSYGYYADCLTYSHGPYCNLVIQDTWACFVNCSQAVTNNSWYNPIACLSAENSHVYVLVSDEGCNVEDLEPFCGYLAMTPLDSYTLLSTIHVENSSYADIIQVMRRGFSVQFPMLTVYHWPSVSEAINVCLINSSR